MQKKLSKGIGIHIELTEEQILELEKLAALGYEPAELAMFFQFDSDVFCRAAEDPESKIYFHIKRGKLVSVAKEQMAILGLTERGDIFASQRLEKIRRNRGFEISKLDIFGGFDDKKAYQKLEDFIEAGCKSDLSADEQIYLEALTMLNSMDRKYGRRKTVAFFTKPPFNLSFSRASEMFDEAMNLFYSDRNIEKKALRHKKAEMLEDLYQMGLKMVDSVKDLEVLGNLQMQAAKLQELDKPDPQKLPSELYRKEVRYFSLDPEKVGIPGINRQLLADQIDSLNIPAADKERVRQDALIDPLNIEQTLDELTQEEDKPGKR